MLHLELAGLSDATVARLATDAGLAPGPVVAAVGGNPFYLSEVLAAPGLEVTPSVRHADWAQVASLPSPCRAALERLAVVPAEVELWLVEALLPDLAVLEPAERRGILVAAQHGIRFRHELARRAVELSLPSVRRIEHHRRVLEALEVAGAEPSRLVHRAFAGLALERSRWLDRLELARLHGVAARALYALNRFGEATSHADRAVEIWGAHGSTPLELGEALLISARMRTLGADPDAARAKALRALDVGAAAHEHAVLSLAGGDTQVAAGQLVI